MRGPRASHEKLDLIRQTALHYGNEDTQANEGK
jgi:hypothetical protein